MSGELLRQFCPLDDECSEIMKKMAARTGISARAFSRVLKLSRTIADLEAGARLITFWRSVLPEVNAATIGPAPFPEGFSEPPILPKHIFEAFSYRFLDRL